jgi:hypothetical protein
MEIHEWHSFMNVQISFILNKAQSSLLTFHSLLIFRRVLKKFLECELDENFVTIYA